MTKTNIELGSRKAELEQARKELAQATDAAKIARSDAERVRSEASAALANLQNYVTDRTKYVDVIVAQFSAKLSPEQLARISQIKQNNPDLVREHTSTYPSIKARLWKNHTQILVAFIDGDLALQNAVHEISTEWTRDTGISFQFIKEPREAQIRISLTENANWSYIGTDALAVPNDQPTMALGSAAKLFYLSALTDFRKVVLTEFGHALGLINEVNNPNGKILWNKDAVFKEFGYMSKDTIERNLLQVADITDYREFDPQSVMMYTLPKRLFLTGQGFEGGNDLSASDKAFIQSLYPKD